MRRIIKIAALAAIPAATLIGTASMASASVTVSDAGTGFIGKGDVQNALGLANDAAIQTLFQSPGGIKFTAGTVTLGNETRWSCSDGSTQSQTSLVTQAGPVNATPNTNNQGKLSNGWNLNGRVTDGSVAGKYIGGKRAGAPYVGYCGAGFTTGFLPNVFTVTSESGPLQVNGVDLPNTPIV